MGLLVSLSEARLKNLARYFTGKPCKNGHISERQTSDRQCVSCKSEKFKAYKQTEAYKFWKKEYRKTDLYKKSKASCDKTYRDKNKEKISEYKSKYKKSKKGLEAAKRYRDGATYNSLSSILKRRASKRASEAKRRVCIESELSKVFQDEILTIYIEAQKLGPDYHVDHIVPINGKDICGLHVPWNLQIITAKENMKKSNKS